MTDKKDKVLRAFNNWILVDRSPPEREEQIGSIVVCNSAENAKQNMGIVVSVGADCDAKLVPGNVVIWGDWPGTKIYWNKKEYVAIRNTDVILAG